jgi:hypothetical protein
MKENEPFLAYKDHIDKISPISQQIWEELKKILLPRNLKKDEYIVKGDQNFNKEIFVYQGIVRGFYCSETGDECNVVFCQENELDKKTQHEIFLLERNAEERYRIFNKIYPRLENKISQYHIASF